jgi:hypothetical protein
MGKICKLGRVQILTAIAMILSALPAKAYYHYVHYLAGPPYNPVFERFDLAALPNKTVTFLVSDSGPAAFAPGDDFASVLSQIRQAAAAWDSVSTSDLRVAFGAVEAGSQPASTPGGDVVFVDLPPGLLGMGAPTIAAPIAPTATATGSFIPIVRSTVMLSKDTNQGAGPSYLEGFFTTAVHEIGHALGLQHTFTGAAMSQAVIRNTSRTRPIDLDDIASISLLYGKSTYAASVGSISGQVVSNGLPVAMASVVAITATGPAVSTFTNPDGTYTIDGLPPNQYWVYVHPAPPDAFQSEGIKGPLDVNGQPIPASGPFETLFFPGTRDPNQFGQVPVTAGVTTPGINFSVQPRAAVPVYDMVTYSYSGQQSVTPAFVNAVLGFSTISAQAAFQLTPIPLSVTVPGFTNATIRPYGSPTALALDLFTLMMATGPRHLLFNFADDMYVLPDGVVLVQKGPPAISAVIPNPDGTVTVTGSNFGPDSSVYFDGSPASTAVPFAGDLNSGSITVIPPPGYSSQAASIIVYGADGQNSTFYQIQKPPLFIYPPAAVPQVTITPSALPAGVSAMVDITGTNMQFTDGQVTAGFGTFDVSVEHVWVLSPNHAIADVVVAPGGVQGLSEVSVISGFQRVFQPAAFQIQPPSPTQPTVSAVLNGDPSRQTIYGGGFAAIYGANLAIAGTLPQVTLSGQPVPVLYAAANQINIQIPAGFPSGPAVLNVGNGVANTFPFAVQISLPPPVVTGVSDGPVLAVNTSSSAAVGDVLTIVVNSAAPALAGSHGRVRVSVAGFDMPVLLATAGPAPGTVEVTFVMAQSFGGMVIPMVVTVDSDSSDPYPILVR